MKFKISNTYFEDKLNSLKRYTTKQEKEVLLAEDDTSLIDILALLSDVVPINEYEATALLFKIREISVSDLIEFTHECKSCEYMNILNIEINSLFNLEKNYDFPVGLFTTVDDIINTKESDDIILKDYNKLQDDIIEQSGKIFNPIVKSACKKCGFLNQIGISPKSVLSKSSASSIYKEYVDISFYTNNSKNDIDTLYPFEREIFINLIQEKLKEQPRMEM